MISLKVSKMNQFHFLLVFCALLLQVSIVKSGSCRGERSEQGFALLHKNYSSSFVERFADCLDLCLDDLSCMSLNFWLNTKRCDLNNHSRETCRVFYKAAPSRYIGMARSVYPIPLGMESGAILDSQISASSVYDANHSAHQARLHFKMNGLIRGCWSSLHLDKNQWLQVDLLQATRVTGIATQGRNGYAQWVIQYKLQHGEDGHTFNFYKRLGDNVDTLFQGNTDMDTVVYHEMNPIIEARYIRVLPTQWKEHISMRMELYTC